MDTALRLSEVQSASQGGMPTLISPRLEHQATQPKPLPRLPLPMVYIAPGVLLAPYL